MCIPAPIKPHSDAAPPWAGGTAPPEAFAANPPPPWPSDMLPPWPDDDLLDETLTEAAGLTRNLDALGPYAGSF